MSEALDIGAARKLLGSAGRLIEESESQQLLAARALLGEANTLIRDHVGEIVENAGRALARYDGPPARRGAPPEGYNVGFNAGEVAGQTVMHLHVQVIPR